MKKLLLTGAWHPLRCSPSDVVARNVGPVTHFRLRSLSLSAKTSWRSVWDCGPHRPVSDCLEALWRTAELLMCWFEQTPASVGPASDYLVSTKCEMSASDL